MVNSWIQDELLSTIYYTPAELFEESDRMKAAIRLKRLGKSLIGLSWQQERCMIRVLIAAGLVGLLFVGFDATIDNPYKKKK